ncbi:glycoside hydrolase domain-containing protein [Actinomadura atramentaria]|uniref:glycoside hydrolase domain-containing protein n=1 Tax=Actinomadura atramentaria TaxID=1990 RepID=UPI0003753FA4|nr:glycoside hydrolase domain-containing protein [Actinomadura atramentaria]
MSVFGVDYAWGRPGVKALEKAGVAFACRYLSHDTSGKNLTRAEAEQLSAAGIWVVVVWESAADRALSGRAGGVADARDAAAQAKACGMPGDRPIYFAVDWDASSGQQKKINDYLDGVASVIGRDRVGLYAGYGPIKRAFDSGKITYGWQTYAWSGGKWDARAQLQQYSNDHTINGVGLDYDRAVKSDYGQWRVGVSPVHEEDDDMPIRSSYGKSKAQDLPWGTFTVVNWDEEYGDPKKAHSDTDKAHPQGYPGYVAPVSSWADMDAVVHVTGMAPGDYFQLRYEVHDWKDNKSAKMWSEVHADQQATTGDQFVTGTISKGLTKGQHVYVAVAVFAADDAKDRPAPKAISGRWTIRQDQR